MLLCAIADVSRKCYYDHRSRRDVADSDLISIVEYIRTIQQETWYAVGYRHMTARIRRDLKLDVNEKRILAIMRSHDLLSVVRRKKYAPIVDLFNREVVAWLISQRPDARLCSDTLLILSKTHDLHGAIIHGDQGSGYISWEYRDTIVQLGAVQSCTKTDRCWENANMESFNGVLKTECLYNRFGKSRFNSRRVRKTDVLDAVVNFIPYYNEIRLKEDLGWLSPVEYQQANIKGTLPVPIGD